MHRVLTAVSIALPMLAGVALAVTYERLPQVWPVHWSVSGAADAFWPRSIPIVFSHVLAAFGVLLVLHVYLPSEPRYRALASAIPALSCSTSALLSLLAVRPVVRVAEPELDITWLIVLAFAIFLGTLAWTVRRLCGSAGARAQG